MERPLYSQLVRYYEILEGRNWKGEIDLVASILRYHGCKSVLDMGCGTGYHVRKLAKLGFEVSGIDISEKNIQLARKKAEEEGTTPRFVVGSYYKYRPSKNLDATLCLNWSFPVKDQEARRFLDNAFSLLRPKGLLIFDYEKISEIVWSDVGEPITESWNLDSEIIVRVSVGQIASNVLSSRDVYIIYPKHQEPEIPSERSRYDGAKVGRDLRIYRDDSVVKFLSLPEIRGFSKVSGFKLIENPVLPRKQYKRNYAVLKKV